MEYRFFTKRQDAYDGFIKMRKKVIASANDGDFFDVFSDVCAAAIDGDCIAQDVAAYFFNRGMPDYMPENYENYMSWEILAGANGNEFALEKLEFFLNSALEEITENQTLLTRAMELRNITGKNALMVISNLLCEGIADELKLEPKKLIDITGAALPYSPKANRKFLDALDKALPKTINVLLS